MPQPTPSIHVVTGPSDHLLATSEEVLPPSGDPTEPINQGMVSPSPLNSTLFPRQNFRRQEGGHRNSRQNQLCSHVAKLSSRQNSQNQKDPSLILNHLKIAKEPMLVSPPLPPRNYKQPNSTTTTNDALPTKEITAPVRRYINTILVRLPINTPISVQPISPITVHNANFIQIPLLPSPSTSISSIHIINPNNNVK